jgi:hypothetical protein
MARSRVVVLGVSLSVLVGCAGAPDAESTNEHRYTVDVSQYAAPNEPPSLFIPNQNLALPLEAKDLTLTESEPGSLAPIYSRSFCEAGQTPPELPGWDTARLLDVPPVHLTAVSITIAFDGNDLTRKPSFAVRDSAGHWSSCAPATQVATNRDTLTATLAVDAANATHVGIFPDTYTYVQSISYSTRD